MKELKLEVAFVVKSPLEQRPDYLVCTCMCVMYSEIIDAITAGTRNYEGLSAELGIGTGCSSCVEEVKQILAEEEKII